MEKLVSLVTQGCLVDLHTEEGYEGKMKLWRLKAESVEESQEGLRDCAKPCEEFAFPFLLRIHHILRQGDCREEHHFGSFRA